MEVKREQVKIQLVCTCCEQHFCACVSIIEHCTLATVADKSEFLLQPQRLTFVFGFVFEQFPIGDSHRRCTWFRVLADLRLEDFGFFCF
ncbi:unnamed protein product [Citrullus colocynthis]|uniref:Uncharacterized protein n=1 Tax=Citrullus colocynthis TaxID=252529 RepID=A0ABP0YZ28_9ROSI